MIYKKSIINFLFVSSFPIYGLGCYVSASMSPSLGLILTTLPYFLIILFYAIDLLYKEDIYIKVNGYYYLVLGLLACYVTSLFVAVEKQLPDFPFRLAVLKSVLMLAFFHAFIIVYLYNQKKEEIVRLAFNGFTVLLLINVVGYFVLGLNNSTHDIEGRISFPFINGLYSGASLVAIINLMLFYFLKLNWNKPITSGRLLTYFLVNLLFLFYINSRLITLISLLVIVLLLLNVRKKFRGLFIVSLATVPILLSAGTIIFEILSNPIFAAIMQRVDFYDITTFNGRSFIWQSGIDWLLYDQHGLIFGNGYKGHYFQNILDDVGQAFALKDLYSLHMHSGYLEILVSQGLVGFGIFTALLYSLFRYYRKKYANSDMEGVFFPVVVFLLFDAGIDTSVYMENLGGLICALLIAGVCIKSKVPAIAADLPDLYPPPKASIPVTSM